MVHGPCCLFRARGRGAGSVPMRHMVATLGAWVVGCGWMRTRGQGRGGRERGGERRGEEGEEQGEMFGELPATGKALNGLTQRAALEFCVHLLFV